MRELVRIRTAGGIVLDLFAGRGTTGIAALETGRRFVGTEVLYRSVEVEVAVEPHLRRNVRGGER